MLPKTHLYVLCALSNIFLFSYIFVKSYFLLSIIVFSFIHNVLHFTIIHIKILSQHHIWKIVCYLYIFVIWQKLKKCIKRNAAKIIKQANMPNIVHVRIVLLIDTWMYICVLNDRDLFKHDDFTEIAYIYLFYTYLFKSESE